MLIILICVISVTSFIILVFLMGCFFKLLQFKQNRRKSNRVEEHDLPSTKNNMLCPPPQLHQPLRFSWEEVERISINFSDVIGQGGFSTVYVACFTDSSTLAALKVINTNSSERLNRLFKQELEILLELGHHENIVNFYGYCDEQRDEAGSVFVLEYVPNGTLHDKLHSHLEEEEEEEKILPWRTRMNIAFQLGQAIQYLHDKCSLQIVHGDIKASNVLLDHQFNCKLCDFGSAKMGFASTVLTPSSSSSSSSTNMLLGSPGYVDPHYLRTGIASKKNDVYSFGVLILELITGVEAFCSEKEKLLTTLAVPMLKDPNMVAEMVDKRIMGDFDAKEARVMTCIAAQCLKQQPSFRPSMSDILQTMKHNISFVSTIGVTYKREDNHLNGKY